jgi:hypothetical protein
MDQNNQNIDTGDISTDSGDRVKFDDNGWGAVKYYQEQKDPKIMVLATKYSGGLIKNEKQAGFMIVILSTIFIIAAFLLFFTSRTTTLEQPPTPLEVEGRFR